MTVKRRRSRRVLLTLLLGIVVLVAAVTWVGRGLGRWLVIEEPLEPAQAIVVLAGGWPFRAMQAADIYHQGAAPVVWLTREVLDSHTETMMQRLGIEIRRSGDYDRMILERLGVPGDAIVVLPQSVRNTAEELRQVSAELAERGGSRVILVTTKVHSRRVGAIWRSVAASGQAAIVRPAREDPFDAARWWANTDDAADVLYELAALLNTWAGFPLQPK